MKVAKQTIIHQVLAEDIFDFLGNFHNLKLLVHEKETNYKSESYRLAIRKLKDLKIIESAAPYKFGILISLNCIKKSLSWLRRAF